MTHDSPIMAYRDHVIERLRSLIRNRHRLDGGRMDLFVNLERVGTLDGARSDASFVHTCRGHVIHHVEVRSEEGRLIGGLNASERAMRMSRVHLPGRTLNLEVRNRMDEGSVNLAIHSGPTPLSRIQRLVKRAAAGLKKGPGGNPDRAWATATAQIVLAGAVLALGADRYLASTREPQPVRVGETEMAALEAQIDRLTQAEAANRQLVESQRDELAQLRKSLADMAAAQQRTASEIKSVSRAADDRKNGGDRDIEHVTRVLLSKAEAERAQFRKELHGLVLANETLAKQVTALENSNVDLKTRLKSAGVDVSKVTTTKGAGLAAAEKQTEVDMTQMAEGRSGSSMQPFTFWVSFQEGTSEENIDHMIREVHGSKGMVDQGWYPVELPSPPPDPLEGFLESVRHTRFVKAVSMTHLSPSAPNR